MMDASTSFAILPSNVKQKTAFERKVNQVKMASWANNCLTGTLDIGQFSCYFVNEKIARVTVNPFGEVDLTPSIAAIHDTENKRLNLQKQRTAMSFILRIKRLLFVKILSKLL